MEAYYHSDPRIEEWVNQITEKIFTVCLLSGADSEVEYQRGCQIVTKVTQLLQGISIFPSEYLEDGLKQLLEQQLPDSRVINNFPTFHAIMNKMLHEGMTIGLDSQKNMNLISQVSSNNNSPRNTKEDMIEDTKEDIIEDIIKNASGKYLVDYVEKAEKSLNAMSEDELVTERIMTALAPVNCTTPKLWEVTEVDLHSSVTASTSLESTKPYGIIRKTQVPEQADRLKHVLSSIFPNVSVCWNLNLMGLTFLAQVEDILIYLHDSEQQSHVEYLTKEGWKVYECTSKDLMFPRRLERGIRQIQRLGKQYKNS